MKRNIFCVLCLIFALLFGGCATDQESPEPSPVIIGIIDTGISTRAISADHILEGKNYLNPEDSTEDTYGHGTAVASVILKHFPEGQLVPLISNVYDKGKINQVDNDVLAQMIKDAVDVYHCQIINLSLGLILDKPEVRAAVEYAEEKGILLVASVGNDYDTDGEFRYFPAAYETVLAVGSVNQEGSAISEFSQRGDWVNVYAPGEEIEIATLSGASRESQGTSFSAAYVTARTAQLLQENPRLSSAKLREKILENAVELEPGIWVIN